LKTIVHVHLQEAEEALRWAFAKPPDVIVTCARTLVEHVRHTLPEGSQQHQRIVAMPNAVDVERFYPGDKTAAKHCVGAPKDKPLVLMVANLAPHKGQETALRATADLKAQSVDIVCWLAGTERHEGGEYTTYLRSLCHTLGIADRVRFLGHRDDVPNLLRAADFFLLPSTSEGLPLSVLEAQATKVPVLAAPTAGIPEVVTDGETGFLIPAEDVAGYASRITSLVGSPEAACRVAERAYATTVHTHTWHAYCERVWELYQDVMEPGNGSSAVKKTSRGAAR
jgi:glycosyltransferase involved in cell wall biosynthesis